MKILLKSSTGDDLTPNNLSKLNDIIDESIILLDLHEMDREALDILSKTILLNFSNTVLENFNIDDIDEHWHSRHKLILTVGCEQVKFKLIMHLYQTVLVFDIINEPKLPIRISSITW